MRILIAILFFTSVCGLAKAQSILPTDTDLQAAYCLVVIQKNIALLTPSQNDSEAERNLLKLVRLEGEDNLKRLKAYLLPRASSLDSSALQAARIRAEADLERAVEELKVCASRCQPTDVECAQKCSLDKSSRARKRLAVCTELAFLPF